MQKTITPDLLSHYFLGTCSRTEAKTVEKWMRTSPENARKAQEWLGLDNEPNQQVADEILMSRNEVWDNLSKVIQSTSSKRKYWLGQPLPVRIASDLR